MKTRASIETMTTTKTAGATKEATLLTRRHSLPIQPSAKVCVHSWFIEPVLFRNDVKSASFSSFSSRAVYNGSIRIWGRLNDRWWRTSSIIRRISASKIITFYGTEVTLDGPIYEPYARKFHLTELTIQAFQNGFPVDWHERIANYSTPFFKHFKINNSTLQTQHQQLEDIEHKNISSSDNDQRITRSKLKSTQNIQIAETKPNKRKRKQPKSKETQSQLKNNSKLPPNRTISKTDNNVNKKNKSKNNNKKSKRKNKTAAAIAAVQLLKKQDIEQKENDLMLNTKLPTSRHALRQLAQLYGTKITASLQQNQQQPQVSMSLTHHHVTKLNANNVSQARISLKSSPVEKSQKLHSLSLRVSATSPTTTSKRSKSHRRTSSRKASQSTATGTANKNLNSKKAASTCKQKNNQDGVGTGVHTRSVSSKTGKKSIEFIGISDDVQFSTSTLLPPPVRPEAKGENKGLRRKVASASVSPSHCALPISALSSKRSMKQGRVKKRRSVTIGENHPAEEDDATRRNRENENMNKNDKKEQVKRNVNRRGRKCVVFAPISENILDVREKDNSQSIVKKPARIQTPKKKKIQVNYETDDEDEDGWSEEQRKAFNMQRNKIGANERDYWQRISEGVNGKSALECRKLWEMTTWKSPTNSKNGTLTPTSTGECKINERKSMKLLRKYNEEDGDEDELEYDNSTGKGSETPDIVMHVRKASRLKQGRNTGKYRNNVRKLAEKIARDTNDEVLEPTIVTPKAFSEMNINCHTPIQNTNDGTPGTEIRVKRAELDRQGELNTPDILARGRQVGFKECDNYIAMFKRRIGTAVPCLPKSQVERDDARAYVPQQNTIQPRRVSFRDESEVEEGERDSEDEFEAWT